MQSINNTFLMVVHQENSSTGRVGERLQAHGFNLDVRCPMIGHTLPQNLSDYTGVVMFGGPMSANDEHLPGIRAELDWLPLVLKAELPYLGICLGAQMMARVLGARVDPHPEGHAEIGYYPVAPTAAGQGLFRHALHVYHWHREGFQVPASAALLARGDTFENQAYRYGDRVYGIQFHPEVTLNIIERWLLNGAERLSLQGAQQAELHRQGHQQFDAELGAWLERFLHNWLPLQPAY